MGKKRSEELPEEIHQVHEKYTSFIFSVCDESTIAERYSKFTEQTGNKNAKKGKFQDAADLLSEGAGSDILLSNKGSPHKVTISRQSQY